MHRPTTESTACEATIKFLDKVSDINEYGSKKEFIILFQSNNPFVSNSCYTEIGK
ncbi:hypothetical protein [Candidatus Orientia mediorientalis]|uniref:hypothetical protein n=1 Tax=Candidatus Orientia mediorientalis TaxID=911112 RepID=UPI000A4E3544|nr:hypothetical protein [Candidatus Orientia mediorientalis]